LTFGKNGAIIAILTIKKGSMKKLETFKSTDQLFKYIKSLLSNGDAKEAGDLFEQFTREWHLEFGEYIEVYDANDIHSIPSQIIEKIDGWELLQKGANSFGIDKICVTRFGDIDVHQDKSTLHTNKKLGTDKAAKMMSLRDNPLKNIRHFVINTTAQDLSHYAKLWKDQTPITFGYDSFIPDENNFEEVNRDSLFWLNIKAKKKNKATTNIFGFVSRGIEQDDYISAGINFAKKSFQMLGVSKWHQLGVGALGKSVLDPVILAELESLFDPIYTKTPKPVNVSFYHSSKTLPKNGWEEVQRRRAKGLYDEVIVISGTDVIDGENDANLSGRFPKTSSVADAVVRIKKALDNNKSVLLLTLYHHAGQIEQIKKQLNRYYKGFKFWYRKRDECDWPCSNAHSSYAPALDNRTESVLTFGSSGTERLGKDPIKDYGVNNINIHGPCAHNFSWSKAEDAGLVKPLILIMPSIKESEVAGLFPEFVDTKGRVDWSLRVNGVAVDNELPTASLIADLAALAKTLVQYPEVKRLLTFTHMVKTNKLAEVNWSWVCKKVLGNSNLDKSAKKLFWQILNDDQYNSSSIKDHNTAIKKAKAHSRYAIGSCRVFGRGYDDKYSPKHHAALHFDQKNIVQTAQELWRVTRLDLIGKTNKPVGGDPHAYYILPMRYNDIDPSQPSWSEDRLRTLTGILQYNKNISDEFESLIKSPNGSRTARIGQRNGKIWIPADFDPTAFSGLVTWVATNRKGDAVESMAIDAHTWLLEKYLALSDLGPKNTVAINREFLKLEKFQPLFDMYKLFKSSPNTFRENFWAGRYILKGGPSISQETKDRITQNLIEFKLYKEQRQNHKEEIIKIMKGIANKEIPRQLAAENNYSNVGRVLSEKFNLPKHHIGNFITGPLTKEWYAKKDHWRNNHRIIYKLLTDTAEDSCGLNDWADKVIPLLETNGISTYNVSIHTLRNRFIRKDYYNALSKEEFEVITNLRKEVSTVAYKSRPYDYDPWNKNLEKKNPKKYNEWCTAVQAGRDKKYKKDKVIS